MSAVWYRARAEMRARWRSTVALALLVGVGGGAVLAAAGAARRTDSAYPRFLEAFGGANVLAANFTEDRELSIGDVAALPSVRSVHRIRFYLLRDPRIEPDPVTEAGVLVAAARSPDLTGPPVDALKILEGRAPDLARPDEAVASVYGAERGLRVGDRFALTGLPTVFPDFARAAERKPLEVRVVGRAAVPGDFPPQVGDESIWLHLTPAFYERYPEQAFGFPGGFAVRLRQGDRDLERFYREYEAIGGNRSFTIARGRQDANVQRSIHLQALALWLLAAFAGVAFVLILGQTLARQTVLEADDHPTLRALGWSRMQLFAVNTVRAIATAAAGAAVAVAVAVALSPVAPIGIARDAEPSPGLSFDAIALGIGAAAIVIVVWMLVGAPAWRAARARFDAPDVAQRPSRLAEVLARAGARPATVAGARLALERGHGRSAMPVLSTVAGLTLGLFVLVSSATFAASLDHFVENPRLYGVRWDARVGAEVPDIESLARRVLNEHPGIRGVAIGRTGLDVTVRGRTFEALVMDPVAGRAPLPPMSIGRVPRPRPGTGAVQEIVFGPKALDVIGARLGDVVDVILGEVTKPMRIVGEGIIPSLTDLGRLGEGAYVSGRGLALALGLPADDENIAPADLFIAGGGDRGIDVALIQRLAGTPQDPFEEVHIWPPFAPTDVVSFGRVQRMPLFLGGFLGLFAAATLAHTLVSAVGRRRRDLAILKTLGFVRSQVRRVVKTQATLLALVALGAGVPSGVAAGRWLWMWFATEQGVVPEAVIHGVTLLVGIPVSLLIARAIAAVPARTAARTPPAIVLRTE